MKIICDIIVKGKMDLFINMGCFMNKSKLKIFIGSILTLNCFITVQKVYSAMKRPPSPPRSSQSSTSRVVPQSYFSGSDLRKQSMSPRMKVSELRRLQNLSKDEVKPVIDSAKKLVNEGNFSISNVLERNLKFIGKNKEDLKPAFELLDVHHYKKSFDDYRKKGKEVKYLETVYCFEKNDPGDERKIYAKFGLNRENKNLRIRTFNDSDIKVDGIDISQDVSKLLNNLEYNKIDLIGRVVDKAISILKSKIESEEYRILGRVKYGLEQLGYTKNEFKNIMRSLTKKDYVSGPNSVELDKDNKWHIQQGDLFIFGYDDPKTNKEIYIKFVIDEETNNISILSFHESDSDLNYFFKELR